MAADAAGMRLDHVLLAVRDLDAATRDFRDRLGLNAFVGGVHPGRGTHNSLVHFGTSYLELISVNDPSAARSQELVRFMAEGDAPYTFALAVANLEAASEAFRSRGLSVDPPRDGSRRTPEGVLLRWRSADLRPGPGGPSADAPPLPFLIQWETDDAGRGWFRERVERARHEMPWGAVHAMLIATEDPPALAAEYERLFGWRAAHAGGLAMPDGDEVNPELGPAPRVVLVGLDRTGELGRAVATRLRRHGAGFLGLAVETPDLGAAVAALKRRGVGVERSGESRYAVVPPADAHGVLLELVG